MHVDGALLVLQADVSWMLINTVLVDTVKECNAEQIISCSNAKKIFSQKINDGLVKSFD